ncbi:phosphatidate cytidylyltransferase [Rhodobacteraceae bacterium N5(2021)]|uniref:Phosphatidate cytidylyltransferase n=1 Tax=Gymnodinialimonas phycosphaerae TaxID=2841589 RepID=A0A975TWL8_9RHOB|nr:phosphatidate cytidylyltransferase [Gymnodinialimonas phycosphaerae]MBY4892307.1 phosphatidate cytidylyltransferase [Gymnodinialimonas phycosphaerae]
MAAGPKPQLGLKFADLMPRIASAVALLTVAGLGLWLGGIVLAVLLSIFGAVMVWEYFRLIIRLSRPVAIGCTVLSSALLALSLILEHMLVAPTDGVLAVSSVAAAVMALCMIVTAIPVHKSRLETLFGAMIPLATFLFFYLHQSVPMVMWVVVAVVISTDVSGYFFGKLIGGPKFWPSLSPNKTWSGTASGWVMAAVIAVAVSVTGPTSSMVVAVVFLIAVAFAAQLSDIAESALKRRAGVKDSSNLLPGHGGALDRFDGMLGAFTVAGLMFVFAGYAVVP